MDDEARINELLDRVSKRLAEEHGPRFTPKHDAFVRQENEERLRKIYEHEGKNWPRTEAAFLEAMGMQDAPSDAEWRAQLAERSRLLGRVLKRQLDLAEARGERLHIHAQRELSLQNERALERIEYSHKNWQDAKAEFLKSLGMVEDELPHLKGDPIQKEPEPPRQSASRPGIQTTVLNRDPAERARDDKRLQRTAFLCDISRTLFFLTLIATPIGFFFFSWWWVFPVVALGTLVSWRVTKGKLA